MSTPKTPCMRVRLIVPVAIMLLAISCKKDNLPDAEGTRLSKIIYRSLSDSTTAIAFTYYDNGKPETRTIIHNNITFGSIRYLYDAFGRLETTEHTSLISKEVYTCKYFYNGNNIVKKLLNVPGYQISYKYIYDAQGRLIADSSFVSGSASYTNFTYSGDNVSQWQSGGTFKATYTNIDNPFYQLGLETYITGADLAMGLPNFSKQLLSTLQYPDGIIVKYDYKFYSNGLPRVAHFHSPSRFSYSGAIEFYYE